jgi:hypothetical protein
VETEDFRFSKEGRVVGQQGTGITESTEILAGKKADGAEVANRAGLLATISCAHRLGGVLDDFQTVLRRQITYAVHVGHLSEEVDGDDRLGSRRDPLGRIANVEVETDRTGIDEDRLCAEARDAARRGEESEAGAEDFVAGTDIERHHGEEKCVGAGADAEGPTGARAGTPRSIRTRGPRSAS